MQVEAELIEHEWHETYYGEFCVMKFETREGQEIYYKGNSKKLLLLTQDLHAPVHDNPRRRIVVQNNALGLLGDPLLR